MTCFPAAVVLACFLVMSSLTSATTDDRNKKISDLQFKNGARNPVFNHAALLKSHQTQVTDLSSSLRRSRLRNLAKSHDTNKNDVIELNELQGWVLESLRIMDIDDALKKLDEEDMNGDGKLTVWEIIHKRYAYTESEVADLTINKDKNEQQFKLIRKDQVRFASADLNHDGLLDVTEYFSFLQPHHFEHMHQPEIDRAMMDLDTNKDGFITVDEFTKEHEHEALLQHRVDAFEILDKDKNKLLTSNELRPTVISDDNTSASDEAKNLIRVCDKDKDGRLSIVEILTNEEEFMESTVTVYGRNLHFVRDEL